MAKYWNIKMNAFDSIVNQLTHSLSSSNKIEITEQTVLAWCHQWCMDALAGKRLGQSFCTYFGIGNASPLYFFRDNNFCRRWICDNYLENETKICKLLYENC